MREKLIEVLEGLFVDYGATAIFFTKGEAEVIADHLIANGVTIPVRCKDCKCSKPTAWYSAKLKCCHPSHMNSQVPHEVLPDHFCSYGERRTDV